MNRRSSRLAALWLRLRRRHFCFDCDGWTWLQHTHVAHPNRPWWKP
jgi:hypothetical protein